MLALTERPALQTGKTEHDPPDERWEIVQAHGLDDLEVTPGLIDALCGVQLREPREAGEDLGPEVVALVEGQCVLELCRCSVKIFELRADRSAFIRDVPVGQTELVVELSVVGIRPQRMCPRRSGVAEIRELRVHVTQRLPRKRAERIERGGVLGLLQRLAPLADGGAVVTCGVEQGERALGRLGVRPDLARELCARAL